MAKKSTWEKREKKVKKEEYLVLGGNTSKKKEGVKRPRKSNPNQDSERSEDTKHHSKTPRTRGNSNTFKGKSDSKRFEGRDDKKSFNPTDFITRDGDNGEGDKFKNRGNANKQFRQNDKKKSYGKFTKDRPFKGFESTPATPSDGLTRLNKYLSMAGICSRREADKFIEQGLVSINGSVVTELGTKVKPSDVVEYAGEKVKAEAIRYILLNKPKDCITTLSDERGRSTVIGLVKNACKERVYPVGRLDRNTTGLILLTNDGDLADKLAHPSNEIRKVYHVITDKNVSIADLKKLETGVQLDDGVAKADAALFAGDGSVRNEIGLEIHSGRNRVVRRMFEAMGYEVTRLDRAAFAGLSKKGLPRGRWRFLTEKEVNYLKML
ncbi:MAG: pseudouridine synthase [Salibacteraceae bacterium]